MLDLQMLKSKGSVTTGYQKQNTLWSNLIFNAITSDLFFKEANNYRAKENTAEMMPGPFYPSRAGLDLRGSKCIFMVSFYQNQSKMTTSGSSNNECHDGNDMPRMNPAASGSLFCRGNKMKTHVVWKEIWQGVLTDAPCFGNPSLWNPTFKGHHISFSTVFTFFPFSQCKEIYFYITQELLEISFH